MYHTSKYRGRMNIQNNDDNEMVERKPVQISNCGSIGVGKTSLTQRLFDEKHDCFNEWVTPTHLFEFHNYTSQNTHIYVFDTSGQEQNMQLEPSIYRNADIVLFLYAANDKKSLERLMNFWVPKVLQQNSEIFGVVVRAKIDTISKEVHINQEKTHLFQGKKTHLQYNPLLKYANEIQNPPKQIEQKRKISYNIKSWDSGKDFAKKNKFGFAAVSAKSNAGCDALRNYLKGTADSIFKYKPPDAVTLSAEKKEENPQKKSGCCKF